MVVGGRASLQPIDKAHEPTPNEAEKAAGQKGQTTAS
jgi:hypothetical protein